MLLAMPLHNKRVGGCHRLGDHRRLEGVQAAAACAGRQQQVA